MSSRETIAATLTASGSANASLAGVAEPSYGHISQIAITPGATLDALTLAIEDAHGNDILAGLSPTIDLTNPTILRANDLGGGLMYKGPLTITATGIGDGKSVALHLYPTAGS